MKKGRGKLKEGVFPSYLHRLGTQDVLVQGWDQHVGQVLDVLLRLLATLLHAAGHAPQGLRQRLLQVGPLRVGGAVLLQLLQVL